MRVLDAYGRLKISTTGGISVVDPKSSITIESPSAAEDASFFYAKDALLVTHMQAVLTGSATPSVTWTIRYNADRSAAGTELVSGGTTTTSTTTGSSVTTITNPAIPAGCWVWLETTAMSGTVLELSVTMFY